MKGRHQPRREKLPYCPTLGPHHMWWEDRHYTSGPERTLRYLGAFILDNKTIALPPQHTLLHRSLKEPPKPSVSEAYDMIGAAKEYGLGEVLQMDNRSTEHLRRQMGILAIPTDEAIERLTRKRYVTPHELEALEMRV